MRAPATSLLVLQQLAAAAGGFPSTPLSCSFLPHAHTIGPKPEQSQHVEFNCSSVATCSSEAASACSVTASPPCRSFGLSPKWNDGKTAQLYTTHWNASISDADWTLYACKDDGPPPWAPPAPPAPPAPAGQCKSDWDCSLNGECDAASGACVCHAPWKTGPSGKEACNVLNVLPHPNDYVPAYGGPRTCVEWRLHGSHRQTVACG
jgi:hypothetical protein